MVHHGLHGVNFEIIMAVVMSHDSDLMLGEFIFIDIIERITLTHYRET